jgi:hypothetical protein
MPQLSDDRVDPGLKGRPPLVGVFGVFPTRPVSLDVFLGAVLKHDGLGFRQRDGGVLLLPSFNRVDPVGEQLALQAGPLTRLGKREGVDRAQSHFARQRLPCLTRPIMRPRFSRSR